MIDVLVPIIRAAVQAGVGAVLAWLIVRGVPVPPESEAGLTLGLTVLLAGLLAKGQQWVERRYPWLGSLLRTPAYGPGSRFGELRTAVRPDERP